MTCAPVLSASSANPVAIPRCRPKNSTERELSRFWRASGTLKTIPPRVSRCLAACICRASSNRFETVVFSMAKIRLEQAGELAVDRQEDEPGPVSPASIEMLPSRDARKSRHELGRPVHEIIETPGSPKPAQQAQADEFARLGGRQPEDRREVTKEIGVLGPNVPLNGRAATKELEPPRAHAMRHLIASAAA